MRGRKKEATEEETMFKVGKDEPTKDNWLPWRTKSNHKIKNILRDIKQKKLIKITQKK